MSSTKICKKKWIIEFWSRTSKFNEYVNGEGSLWTNLLDTGELTDSCLSNDERWKKPEAATAKKVSGGTEEDENQIKEPTFLSSRLVLSRMLVPVRQA